MSTTDLADHAYILRAQCELCGKESDRGRRSHDGGAVPAQRGSLTRPARVVLCVPMPNAGIEALKVRLDSISSQLEQCKDPYLRKSLLYEMRVLMAELDRAVLESAKSYSARPQMPPKDS